MLRCNYNSLNIYDFKEFIGVSILSLIELCYFIVVLVHHKINSNELYHFNNRAYKTLRYFLGLQSLIVMFFLPLYILYTFKDCDCCFNSSQLFDVIPLIPYCIILTFLFFAYLFSFDNMKHHKPTLVFYTTFFIAQIILYTSTIFIVGFKIFMNQDNYLNREERCTLVNIFQQCSMEPIMMDYIFPVSLFLIPCTIFTIESVYFLTNTQEKSASIQKQFSQWSSNMKIQCV